MDVDIEELTLLLETLEGMDFSQFVYEKGDVRIEVRRGAVVDAETSAPVPAPAPAVPPAPAAPAPEVGVHAAPAGFARQDDDVDITAPLLGTVYLAPKPGETRFVEVGSSISEGDTVCIVEVMKLMNSVPSPVTGTIVAVHVGDGDLAEFGQVLFTVRPEGS